MSARAAAHRAGGSNLSFLDRALCASDKDNFPTKPGMGDIRGSWGTAGKGIGAGGAVLSGVTEGWDQWNDDADEPGMSNVERGTRAATVGGMTGAGVWAGGEAGARIGGSIGTAILPVGGTVVGGVVGGVIGGAVGAYAGSEFGHDVMGSIGSGTDWTVDHVGDAASATWDAAGDVASGAGDAVSGLAGKATFWD